MNSKKPRFLMTVDDLPPQDVAMLQALYSRDPRSVVDHLAKVAEVGAGKFMEQYYVGYGHKSIGDCGSTTLFVEQVSMLVAKAIQDWSLYSGQEASTRYLDMSQQEVLNPLGTEAGAAVQERSMRLYRRVLDSLVVLFKEKFPIQEGEKEAAYLRAINAKAFDVARGFLPAGTTTLVSWHTNLRQAADHLKELRHHPLAEVRDVVAEIHGKLVEKYPQSFGHRIDDEEEAFLSSTYTPAAYSDHDSSGTLTYDAKKVDRDRLAAWTDYLSKRPRKAAVSRRIGHVGPITFRFELDFGSFRDVQRHRNGTCDMPLLSTRHGFHQWYLSQLPEAERASIEDELAAIARDVEALGADAATRQYYVPMGYIVICEMTYDIAQSIYVAELRSGQTVHPTLRVIAQLMAKAVLDVVPNANLYYDATPDEWSTKRGNQTIVEKK